MTNHNHRQPNLQQTQMTCEALSPEAVTLSQSDQNFLNAQVVQIYKIKTVKDQIDAYNAGDLPIPDGKTNVTVLTCTGTAVLNTTEEAQVRFFLAMDLNGDPYVGIEPS